ncbi:MAG: hypothetical protein K5673_05715 [Lachnospiraceae bacterium]|nr:hypothetical protein [Lachnospiraceae bacterium]
MDGKSIFEQDLLKKEVKMNEGILNVEKKDDMIGRNSFMDISAIDMKDVQDQDDSFDDLIIKDNKELVKTGKMLLREFDEKEIIMGERLSIESFKDSPLAASATRRRRFGEYPKLSGQGQVAAGDLLGRNTSKVVKRGGFGNEMIVKGQEFVRRIKSWATASDIQDAIQGEFLQQYGTPDIIDCLYVDGMPIREFVAGKYAYNGSEDKAQERNILSAYAVMIASRQNHPITLVRPVLINGVADIDIRNVGLDMRIEGRYMSRRQKTDAIRYGLEGERYLEYCETAFRSEMRAKAGEALRTVKGKTVSGLSKLAELNRNLNAAGKGTHRNYDEFVMAFNRYFNILQDIGRDPDHMEINREELHMIYDLNTTVLNAAHAYLKGKKMNLPRHHAVKEIRDLVSSQSGKMWGVIRGKSLNEEGATISLKDLLDKKNDQYAVYDIEEEAVANKQRQQNDQADTNEYVSLDKEIELDKQTKLVLRMRHMIDSDDVAAFSFERLKNAAKAGEKTEDELAGLAMEFLKAASTVLLEDEKIGTALKRKYKNAVSQEDLLHYMAEDQLAKLYKREFAAIPALKDGLNLWTEHNNITKGALMTYRENIAGDALAKDEYDKIGGAGKNLYVSSKEAKEIVKNSKGFLCSVKVKGQKDLRMIKPSLPEKVEVTGKDNKKETIKLRRTMNLMIKTMAYMITNEDGTVKAEEERYGEDNMVLSEYMDQLFRDLAPKTKNNTYYKTYDFVVDKFMPAMEEMLNKEYKARGMSKSDAKYKANQDAIEACESFFKLLDANTSSFIQSPDVAFHSFRCMGAVLRSINREEFINSPEVKKIRIGGVAPTPEEINQALDEFMAEQESAEAELKKIREMDPDSEQVACFNSCIDNSKFYRTLFSSHTDDKHRHTLEYKAKSSYKTNPMKITDYLLNNLDRLCDMDHKITDKDRAKYREKLQAIKDSYQKEGKLSMGKMDDLRTVHDAFARYEIHQAPFMSKQGTDIITVETYGLAPDHIVQSPVTMNPAIGRYKSTKEGKVDQEGGTMEHKGFTGFYSHVDYFDHTKSRMKLLKTNLRQILSDKWAKMLNSEV